MSGLFGNRAPKDRTILIIDVENSSIGCALVRLGEGKQPRLFAETRVAIPILSSLGGDRLLKETDIALREALLGTSITAARMRNHPKLSEVGIVGDVSIFVGPPWTALVQKVEKLAWQIEPQIVQLVSAAVADIFGDVHIAFHPTNAAIVHTTNTLFTEVPDLLLSTVTGEVTELSLLEGGAAVARATIPLGKHFLLRTLQTHGGLSLAEAHSALRLSRTSRTESPAEEALFAAGTQYAKEFSSAAADITKGVGVQGILVIANEPTGEWVAQNLAANESLSDLFTTDTTIQALHAHHISKHLAAHGAKPDLLFMTEAMFVDSKK